MFVSSPFILLLAWYALTNNLYNFYYQAYKINTTIYPEYLGGYGTSPILSIFQGVDNYFGYFCEGMKQLLLDTSFGIRILLNIFINIAFIFFVFKKNNTAKISIFLFTLMCAPRGFIGFHSMAYYGVTLIMGTILLDNLIKNHLKEMTWKEKSILLFALFNFITPFFLHFSEILRVPSVLKNKDTKSGYGLIIQELTDENDKIYVTSLDIGIYIDSNRIPVISSPSSVPWMYRALGEKELRFVNQYKPKVAVFDKNFEVWGYKQAQYAPEILTFIKSNYTNLDLPDVPFLYVRNDYLKEAKARLGIKSYNFV